jgi:glycosyltransferase involved in cell wall biosynthesis
MKILHVVPSYKPAYVYGGTIESIARLCEALANAGQDVKVFTTTANGAEELEVVPNSEYDIDGVKVVYFKRIFKDPFYLSPALWKRLYNECRQYDVVHIHSWWNMIVMVAAFICRKQKVRVVLSPHGMFSEYILNNSKKRLKQLSISLFGKSLLKACTFHATSSLEFAECRQFVPGWKGCMIPNIVWLPKLTICKQANSVFTIIFLSRIHRKKGIELLMQAISGMQIKPLLKLAGSGEEKYIQQLKQEAKTLGIHENIEWLGWQGRDEKFTAMMHADLFALTSYNENFGNVVIEALHAGTPVLISNTTGLSRFVKEHQLGWVCTPEADHIRSALEAAIADSTARDNITRTAPSMVAGYFSEEKLIPEYIRYYQT